MNRVSKSQKIIISLVNVFCLLVGMSSPFLSHFRLNVHAETNPNLANESAAPYSIRYGSGYWPTSSIREWLNSDAEAGAVIYTNEPPSRDRLGNRAYDQEPGFLYEFSENEKNGIAVTERRVFVHSTLGSKAKDGGSGDVPRYDGLVPSGNIHISSPDIDKNWKKYSYQVVKEKVFLLGIHEIFEYVQKRGFSTKKGLTDEAKNLYNINSPYYSWMTSTYNYSNQNGEDIWGYTADGYGKTHTLSDIQGVAPALHLKPDYVLPNGKKAKDLSIGEVLTFGTYHGYPIEWKVINVTPEGFPLLWSTKILTIKRYDAPGSSILRNSISVRFDKADISLKDDLKFTNGTSDNTPPYLRVLDDSALFQRQNSSFSLTIEAVDHESGIAYIILPDGTFTTQNPITYEFTQNKRYYFTAVDRSGNHYGFEIPVGNLNPPAEVLISASANGWTNKDVTVEITTTQADTTRIVPEKITKNNSTITPYFTEYTSYSGKTFRISGKVKLIANVDTNYSAIIRMVYRSISKFGNNYRVYTKYPIVVKNPIQNLSKEEYTTFDATYTVPGDYFDEPFFMLGFDHGAIYNGNYTVEWKDVRIELLDKEDFQIKKIILPNGKEIEADSYTDTLTQEGTYTYLVLDSRGKITEQTITVKIDKKKPTLTITPDITKPTNGNVVLSINATDDQSGIKQVKKPNGEWDTRSSFIYNIYENGSYTFVAEDHAGNQTSYTVNISNIDKTPPDVPIMVVSESKETNQPVSISIQYPSDSVKNEVRVNGGDWFIYSSPILFRKNGYIEARATDQAGNVSKIAHFQIQNINPTPSEFTITPSSKGWTNQPILLTIQGSPYIKSILLPDGTLVQGNLARFTAYRNGEYAFIGFNQEGRISEMTTYLVKTIDLNGKMGIIVPNSEQWTNEDVEVHIQTEK